MVLPIAKTNHIAAKWCWCDSVQWDFSMACDRMNAPATVSDTWKSINVTHSCWAFAFIVADLSRISAVLMIKLNFTFVLSSMLAVAPLLWCISSIQCDFEFTELIHYIGDCQCTCACVRCTPTNLFHLVSLVPAFSHRCCIVHWRLYTSRAYQFLCLFGIDKNR